VKKVISVLKWIGLALLLLLGVTSTGVCLDDVDWIDEEGLAVVSILVWISGMTYAALKKRAGPVAILSAAAIAGSLLVISDMRSQWLPAVDGTTYDVQTIGRILILILAMVVGVVLVRQVARWKAEGNFRLANQVSGLAIAVPVLATAAFATYIFIYEFDDDSATSTDAHISSQFAE
jgi:hypothetical protein